MKKLLMALVLAAAVLTGCKSQDKAGNNAASALDVIMTRTSIRAFTGAGKP